MRRWFVLRWSCFRRQRSSPIFNFFKIFLLIFGGNKLSPDRTIRCCVMISYLSSAHAIRLSGHNDLNGMAGMYVCHYDAKVFFFCLACKHLCCCLAVACSVVHSFILLR